MRGLAIILLGLAAALFLHHRWEPPTLLVDAVTMDSPDRHVLVAPCPVEPRNLPKWENYDA